MTAVVAILRREWEAYFRTTAGWVVLTLFLALQGVVFWMFLRLLSSPDAPPGGVMEFFFGGTMMYWIALALLVTVAPMRLLAEELRSGTIEPLLTAPVTAAEVVIGKWLAALTFFATAWVPTLAYVVYLRATGASLDAGPIAAGYLGTLLLGAAAMAVGVAASAMTRNQLVAAALSFVAFFVVLLGGALEGQVRSPELAAARPPRQPVPHDGGLRSRHRRLAPRRHPGDGHRHRAADRRRGGRPPARPDRRGCATRASRAGLAGADPGRGHRRHDQRAGGPPLRARRLDARVALRSVAADGRGAARAAPAGRGDDLPVREPRFGQGARRGGADARDHGPAARADPAVHARFGRALPAPSRSIPIATRSAPRAR